MQVGGQSFDVKFEGDKAVVNGVTYDFSVGEAGGEVQHRSSLGLCHGGEIRAGGQGVQTRGQGWGNDCRRGSDSGFGSFEDGNRGSGARRGCNSGFTGGRWGPGSLGRHHCGDCGRVGYEQLR